MRVWLVDCGWNIELEWVGAGEMNQGHALWLADHRYSIYDQIETLHIQLGVL